MVYMYICTLVGMERGREGRRGGQEKWKWHCDRRCREEWMMERGHLIHCPQSEILRSVVRTLQSLSMCVCVRACMCVPHDSSYFVY